MKKVISTKNVQILWIREPYLAQILDGRKTIEVRVGYDNIRHLQPGDRLKLNDQHLAIIRRIGHYDSFEELLANEDPAAIAPHLANASGQGETSGDLLATLRRIYPPEKEALGVVALELQVRRYDAILFDLGYTLITFEPAQEIIVQETLREVGAERSVEEINAAAQVVWGEYYRDSATKTYPATEAYNRESELVLSKALLTELGLVADDAVVRTYFDAIEAAFRRPGVLRPFAEVVDVLETLRDEGYRLAIVSNWSWNLRERVEQVGLDGYFEVIWASAYAGCNKPHPDIFHQALALMPAPELAPDRILYVGDSYEHDVAGARNAGLDVVLVDRPGTAAGPDCPVIRDLRGLFDLLGE